MYRAGKQAGKRLKMYKNEHCALIQTLILF